MDLNCKNIVPMNYDNSEILEEGFHFTHHFVPPNQHAYYHKEYKKETSIEMNFLPAFSEKPEIDDISNNTGYDVILTGADTGHYILAHRKKLASESVYFGAMFSGYFVETNTFEIKIHGVSTAALRKLVTFCYTKCIQYELFDVEEIVTASKLMLFDDIVDEGLNYLKTLLQPQTCLNIYTFAQEHHFEKLALFAIQYARFYFVQVSKTNQFLEISLEILIDLIKTKDQKEHMFSETHFFHKRENIYSPFELFYAVLRWINFDDNLRKSCIFDLLTHIPFGELYQQIKEHIIHLEKQSSKYDQVQFQQFEGEKNASNSSDSRSEFILFKTVYNGLKVFCPVFHEFRLLTKFYHNIHCFGQCLFEDKIILAGGLEKNPKGCFVESRKVAYLSLQNFMLYDLPSMNTARSLPGVAILDTFIYVCGGEIGDEGYLTILTNTVERYDLVNKQWTFVTPMIDKRGDFFMCALDKRLYVIGGTDPENYIRNRPAYSSKLSVECYNSEKEEWNIIAKLDIKDANEDLFRLPNAHFVFNNIIHSFAKNAFFCEAKIFTYDQHSNSWNLIENELEIGYAYPGRYKYSRDYTIIHSEDNTFIIGIHSVLPGITNSCFMVYKVVKSGNCQLISAPWRNRFSVSRKILAQNLILRPDELNASTGNASNS